jgi:hypothetical protein
MAADRQRLAQALADEAARRRLFESIPEAAGQGLPQALESTNYGRYLENLSIGLGRGAVNQLEGLKGLVTSPVESVKGIVSDVGEAIRNPRMIAKALQRTGERAASGPLGLGEVVGENFNMARVPSAKPVMSEINVYHGSPHKFEAFDASKIGTGEGAQAYGHGIYLAESPKVAQGYKERLSASSYEKDSQSIAYGKIWQRAADAALETGTAHPDYSRAISSQIMDWVDSGKKPETFLRYNRVPLSAKPAYEAAIKEYAGLKKTEGNLYTADLPDEMVDRMLDWDKPLSEQSQAIKKAMGSRYESWKNSTGQDLYEALSEGLGGDKATSDWLRENNISGIRYLDAGSRLQGGSGTRNFVVFPGEEKKVKILKRE